MEAGRKVIVSITVLLEKKVVEGIKVRIRALTALNAKLRRINSKGNKELQRQYEGFQNLIPFSYKTEHRDRQITIWWLPEGRGWGGKGSQIHGDRR